MTEEQYQDADIQSTPKNEQSASPKAKRASTRAKKTSAAPILAATPKSEINNSAAAEKSKSPKPATKAVKAASKALTEKTAPAAKAATKTPTKAAKQAKSAAKESAPAVNAPSVTPSLEEVAAFVESIKGSRGKAESSPRKETPPVPASPASSTASSHPSKENNTPKESRMAEVKKAEKGQAKKGDKAKDASRKSGQAKTKPDEKGAQRVAGQDADRMPLAELASSSANASGSENNADASISTAPQFTADGKPISKREQRRLQWLEKRRAWIEQRKLERMAGRKPDSAPDSAPDATSAPAETRDIPAATSRSTQQPRQDEAHRNQQRVSADMPASQGQSQQQENVSLGAEGEIRKKRRRGGKKHRERMERREARLRELQTQPDGLPAPQELHESVPDTMPSSKQETPSELRSKESQAPPVENRKQAQSRRKTGAAEVENLSPANPRDEQDDVPVAGASKRAKAAKQAKGKASKQEELPAEAEKSRRAGSQYQDDSAEYSQEQRSEQRNDRRHHQQNEQRNEQRNDQRHRRNERRDDYRDERRDDYRDERRDDYRDEYRDERRDDYREDSRREDSRDERRHDRQNDRRTNDRRDQTKSASGRAGKHKDVDGDDHSDKQPRGKAEKSERGSKSARGEKGDKRSPQRAQSVVQDGDAPPPLPPVQKPVLPPKRFFIPKDISKIPDVSDEVYAYIEKVELFLNTELAVENGSSILVCVSGGVDSIVLLDILSILSYERGYTLNVAHVNHNLRPTAKSDERFVRQLADTYDVNCHTTTVNVPEFAKKHSLSEEEAGRELRYKFFRQTASSARAQYCATAHNADDAAETLLMNLFRGTGLTGLASIPPRRALIKKTQLIRPLLSLTKQEILEYARLRQLEWQEDETNTLTKYTRNKVRHDLLPKLKEDYNPNIIKSLNRTANLLRKADGFIDSLIHSTYVEMVEERDNKTIIDVNKIATLHEFLQSEIIERAVTTLTFGKPVSFAAIDRVLGLLQKEVGSRETLVNNLIAIRNREQIVLMYEEHLQEIYLSVFKLGEYKIGQYSILLEEVTRNEVRIGESKDVEYFDYDRVPYRLTLRTWHHGDSFYPIGMSGHVKVSDFLTNSKIEHAERHNALVLATASDIMWLCGMRMSDEFKLLNETRRIIKATFKKG